MSEFAPTEARIHNTIAKYPAFPREPAVLVRLVKHIYKEVHDQANGVMKAYGLNHPEYNILMMLYGAPDNALNPSQLADAAGEKSANVTRLTTRLCDMGYIARAASEDDRRKVELKLTPAGLDLIQSFLPDIVTLLHRQTRNLSPSEQGLLEGLLKKMLAGFGE
ncbi:MarR family transcriptional regulator [Luteibacter pinisoli]|jgi:MarR family transcriptional repressor of emrRAB|uniref:MarR family transcriptional regulator n=1 Tax=Luteibacter pinisoli TaxID=2589080 RepID=A0A4Y5Z0M7_9GAMM|nr:MarR family transcriptional regulator [Luteibacter pinisoli]QDE38003.1 MarR family transcriptional regulator [Luteibacter pinisoli]